ncbi:MAG: type 2 isopentenyl-diphosphate Delta-isomerase [Deltaproteobacteria bacterium]|nr:type 2 isopentenyl-diphosphate Delta-isomerase [Deltaproteobacteria bacterium]
MSQSQSADASKNVRDPKSKLQHIEACLKDECEYRKSTGFERFSFVNQALCDVSLEDISLETHLVDKSIGAPLMIASMTGGVEQAFALNQMLARAAEKHRIPMGVGSQRVGIEDDSRAAFFNIRKDAPNAFLFANIGAVQLAKGWGVDEAKRAVDMIEADALFLHINPIQEAIQGGDVDFKGLAKRIKEVTLALRKQGIPVFAREVGFGISEEAARVLVDCGVAGIDCAGAGGTSWAKVEGMVAKTERRRILGARFAEWGIPTSETLQMVRRASSHIPLIATGGIRDGVDVAKAIGLGADIVAMARPFLQAAHIGNNQDENEEAIDSFIHNTLEELRICMFGIGAADVEALNNTRHLSEKGIG